MFDFPKINREDYSNMKRNFLRTVIFQIKFDSNLNVCNLENDIKNSFSPELPRFQNINSHEIGFSIGDNQTPFIQSKGESFGGFELRSEDGNKTLTISSDAITLQVSGLVYDNYERHKDLFNLVIGFCERANIRKLNRVAIRKVNVIEFNNTTLTPIDGLTIVLNSHLVESLKAFDSNSYITNHRNTIQFKKENDKLNLIYGFNVLGEGISQVYIDMDLFKESNNGVGEINNVLQNFTEINDELFNIFHWSLGGELQNSLKNN